MTEEQIDLRNQLAELAKQTFVGQWSGGDLWECVNDIGEKLIAIEGSPESEEDDD